jgi:hypothetical protein
MEHFVEAIFLKRSTRHVVEIGLLVGWCKKNKEVKKNNFDKN